MLVLQSKPPVDYTLCNQTVTIYHKNDDNYTRTVRNDVFFDWNKSESVDKTGRRESEGFLLVIPGEDVTVSNGDKILLGEGPECNTREEWAALIPAKIPGLVVVQSVAPKYWHGRVVHVEAS